MLRPETTKIQNDLAMYCRSGKEADIPGITEGRLPHYRRLVLNVVHGSIVQAYPITRKVLSEDEWKYLFNSFFVEHDSQTPILWKLPYEFYLYAKENEYYKQFNKPWLTELLWIEWLEIEVHMMPDSSHPPYMKSGDVLSDHIIINRDSKLIQLEYPVHLHSVEEAAKRKAIYYVFAYRKTDSGKVRFLNLSVLHAWLMDRLMNDQRLTVNKLMPELMSLLKQKGEQEIKKQIKIFLEDMLNAGLILGFSK